MIWSRRKSALLIDFENLHAKCGGRQLVERMDNWLLWLEHGAFDPAGVRRQFISKQVFWVPSYEKYRLEFAQREFEIHMCRAIRKEKASSADFDLTIRAAELRHERKDLKEVVILSLDSDFVSILGHVQLHDLHGVGMVDPEAKFAQSFRNIVDLTIEKPAFMNAMNYAPPKRGWFGAPKSGAKPKPPVKPAAAKPAPTKPARATQTAQPQPAAPSTAQSRATASFDYRAAALNVTRYAEENDIVYLGQELLRRLLTPAPGFMVNDHPWTGGPFRQMIEQIAQHDPRLKVERKQSGKGVVLVFRGGPAN
ncbi:MAG: NYN domain-containing protein [Terricaulis sp.]